MEVKFDISKKDAAHVKTIMDRAVKMASGSKIPVDRLSLEMDIVACHANGCPLRLADLAIADDVNLAHDVFGISRHIDRETGKLTNHFLPRFHA